LIRSLETHFFLLFLCISFFIIIIVFRQANEQTSDFIDKRASNDQDVLASLFDDNINEQIPLSSSSIPMTTILPIQTESRTDVWISRLPNTPSLTEADYESQV